MFLIKNWQSIIEKIQHFGSNFKLNVVNSQPQQRAKVIEMIGLIKLIYNSHNCLLCWLSICSKYLGCLLFFLIVLNLNFDVISSLNCHRRYIGYFEDKQACHYFLLHISIFSLVYIDLDDIRDEEQDCYGHACGHLSKVT